MERTKEKTAIEALSENVLSARFEDLEARIVENAKNRIIDILGCVIGSANAAGNQGLLNIVRKWGGSREATIMVHGDKVPAGNAAMMNAIMCRSNDFEAMSIVLEGGWIPSHHSGTTVMTALTMGEVYGINGKELITAMVAGDDVVSRVLAAGGWDFGLGWDGTMTLPIFGSIPIAGRIMGLNAYQIRQAFGIGLNMIAGAIQSLWDGSAAFKLGQGTSARNGIFAAELAKEGWTGVEDALQSRFGYYYLYGKGAVEKPEILTQFLGKRFYVEETFKSHPCGWPNQGPIQCAMEIVKKVSLKADDVEEVLVRLPAYSLKIYYAKPYVAGDFPQSSGIFSYQFNVATALLNGDVQLEHYTEKAIKDLQLNMLINKTHCVELPHAGRRSVEVVVKMKDGREFAEHTDIWKGDPLSDPLSKDEIIAKFWRQVDFAQTISRERAGRILDLVEKLEELDNVQKITELLSRQTEQLR
jgi:2-methylcitrate dehydratase PrpD